MSTTKPLPIAPQVIVPHQTSAALGSKKSSSGGGMTIRTSRHWVLPPRPKPGRKPNHYDAKRAKQQTVPVAPSVQQPPAAKPIASVPLRKSATAPACLTKRQVQAAAAPVKKQTKTALKREIQHIRVENSKLKQELGQLVGDLQALKQRYNSPPASRKRHLLDDSTLAFLKFEEDDAQLPPLLVSNAAMHMTSSVSSCKTVATDDEDVLTMSSSTPNSLISTDLQHSSSSVSSASSLGVNAGHAHGQSPTIHGKPQLKFLDDYEQMEFYDKYMRMDFGLHSQGAVEENPLDALGSIKEEESAHDDILNFLENPLEQKDEKAFFAVKKECGDDDGANFLMQPSTNDAISTTISDSGSSNFYMPPSLEELMEEQDGGLKNFSANPAIDGFNGYEDNLDMLKMEAFEMI